MMEVNLVARTELTSDFYKRLGGTEMSMREMNLSEWVEEPDLLAEAAGRVCYDSFHLPREATRENADYLANIKRQLHFSVVEHATFAFHVSGVSRALLAELTRHRHLSFSVRSQRYCDESHSRYVFPEALVDYEKGFESQPYREEITEYKRLQREARELYSRMVEKMTANGLTRKEAHDAARYVLPEGTCTEFYVTGNGRAWLEFLSKRDSSHAANEIHELASRIRSWLQTVAPGIFGES